MKTNIKNNMLQRVIAVVIGGRRQTETLNIPSNFYRRIEGIYL
jgi:hypothetical protein